MLAPTHLPDTALVDNVYCYVRDDNSGASANVGVQLERKYVGATEVCCTDTSVDSGDQYLTCNNGCEEDVDNITWGTFNVYYIKATIGVDTDTTDLAVYHCSVKYHLP